MFKQFAPNGGVPPIESHGSFGSVPSIASCPSVIPSPSVSGFVGSVSSLFGSAVVDGSSIPVVSSPLVNPSLSQSSVSIESHATSLSVIVTVPLGSVLLVFPLVTAPFTVKISSPSAIASSVIEIVSGVAGTNNPAGIVTVTNVSV